MKQALLLLPLLALPAGDSIEYKASEGDRIRITSEQSAEISLVDQEVTILVDGEEQQMGDPPDVEVTLSLKQTVVFIDEIRKATDEGEARQIHRSFETLNGVFNQEVSGLPEDVEAPEPVEIGSDLEGGAVLLTWDDDEGDWTVEATEDASYEEESLEPIEHNADLTYLLPGEEIEAGSSWELEAEEFRRMMDLSGEIDMKPVDGEDEEDEDFDEVWESENFILTVKEMDDSTVTITIEVAVSRTEEGEMEMELPPEVEAEPPVITMVDVLEWELTGELIWNREANRPESVSLEGTLARNVDRQQEMSGPMGDVSVHEVQGFEGPFEVSMTFEDAPEGE